MTSMQSLTGSYLINRPFVNRWCARTNCSLPTNEFSTKGLIYEVNRIPTRKYDQKLSSNDQAAAETFAGIQIGLIRVSSNQICRENKPGMTTHSS